MPSGDAPGPIRAVLLTARAARAMDAIAVDVYEQQRTEWGGVTFGRLWSTPEGLVVVIEEATRGLCGSAGPTRCDILAGSWEAGERELLAAGRPTRLRIGTFHSHPRMAARPSGLDVTAFWGYANVAHFVGVIVNPYPQSGPDHSCWVLDRGAERHRRVPSYVIADVPRTRAWFEEEAR